MDLQDKNKERSPVLRKLSDRPLQKPSVKRISPYMLQQFTRSELLAYNRTQLWELCRERGVKCYPKTADCVEAIWNKQQSVEKVAVAGVATSAAPKTCATCPPIQPFNDGTGHGLCCEVADTSLVVQEHYSQTQDEHNLIDEQTNIEAAPTVVAPPVQTPVVQSGSLTFKKAPSPNPAKTVYEVFRGVDSLGIIVRDTEGLWSNSCDSDGTLHYATPFEAAAAFVKPNVPNLPTTEITTPEIEVDSDIDADFGVLYRVWNSRTLPCTLLGTFYHASSDGETSAVLGSPQVKQLANPKGKWVAQPCDREDRPRCNTSLDAQLLIMAVAGLLVVDTNYEETDALQDLPFDELTPDDWKRLKQQEFLQPIAA